MKQPIAGVTPAEWLEATITTVWPSIAAYPSGQLLGRLYSIRWPDIYIFRLGNLLALLSIPYALCPVLLSNRTGDWHPLRRHAIVASWSSVVCEPRNHDPLP